MKCIGWRQGGCIVLVQLAALAGCARTETALSEPTVHLVIPEDFRGEIDFDETNEPLKLDANGNARIEVRSYGSADIDSMERLESAVVTANLSSGESLKTKGLRPHEVGLRSVAVYYPQHKSIGSIYFVGTLAALEEYLAEAFRTANPTSQLPASEQASHRVESKPNPWVVAHTVVTQEAFDGAPKWDGTGDPPVGLEHAVKLAKEALNSRRILGDPDPWARFDRAILMKSFANPQAHWYWRIRYECLSPGGHIEIVVLMNGRVLPVDFVESSRQIEPVL